MYKIIISKEETIKSQTEEYKQIADTGNDRDDGPVYGYVTKNTTDDVETTMFVQRVEKLDMVAVINAVNKEA